MIPDLWGLTSIAAPSGTTILIIIIEFHGIPSLFDFPESRMLHAPGLRLTSDVPADLQGYHLRSFD